MASLSVILITYNEEINIERCLKSVGFAGEVIVVDSGSTDRTLEIAHRYTDKIIQRDYDGDIPQREYAFRTAKGEWLFYIDADEEVSEELRQEISSVIGKESEVEGYYVPRKVSAFGSWIMHGGWYPDYTFRLFKKDKYMPEYAEVHGGFTAKGRKERLNAYLYHYTYRNLSDYVNKMNNYTSLQVSSKLQSDIPRSRIIMKILFSPPMHFVRKYFFQKGYRDGIPGFMLALLGSISTLALYSKLWEFKFKKGSGQPLPPITNVDLQKYKKRYNR